jgi:GNAT superfamily N-acetyltransferase
MLEVRDVDEAHIEDVFRVCSHANMDRPIQRVGIEFRSAWLRRMLAEHGPCAKVAYLDDRPVAQIEFIPEEVIPYVPEPRLGVVQLRCVYNPFPEARGKGVATALIRSLVDDCERGLASLKGRACSFIAAEPFNTGEGTPMDRLYAANGFEAGEGEIYRPLGGSYVAPRRLTYRPSPEDAGRAVVLFNPTCEYSYGFAMGLRGLIGEVAPKLDVDLVDQWERPRESIRRGNHWLVVNATPITASWADKKALRAEIEAALQKKW